MNWPILFYLAVSLISQITGGKGLPIKLALFFYTHLIHTLISFSHLPKVIRSDIVIYTESP